MDSDGFEGYAIAGRKAGEAFNRGNWLICRHQSHWLSRARALEDGEKRRKAIDAFLDGYLAARRERNR